MKQRIIANIGLLTAARFAGAILSALTVAIAARAAGPAEFGRFSYALVFVALFTAWTDHGFNLVVARLGAERPERLPEVLGNAILIKAVSGLTMAALAVAVAVTIGLPPDLLGPIAIASLLVLITSLNVVNVYFQITLRMGLVGGVEVASKVLGLAGVAALWALGAVTAERLVLIQVAMAAAGVAVLARLAVASARPRWRVDGELWRLVLSGAGPLTISLAFSMTSGRVDVLALERLSGTEAVGLYSVPARIIDVFLLLPGLTMNVFFPLFVERMQYGPAAFTAMFRKTLDLLLAVAVPLGLVTAFSAPELVRLVGGPGFDRAAPALAVLALVMVLMFYGTAVGHAIIAAGRERVSLYLSSTGIVAAGAVALLLIPKLGLVGAALATTAAHATVGVLAVVFVWRRLEVVPLPRSPLAIALVSGVLASVMWGSRALGLSTWPAVVLGALAGGAAALVVPQLRDDVREMLSGLGRSGSSPHSSAPTSEP